MKTLDGQTLPDVRYRGRSRQAIRTKQEPYQLRDVYGDKLTVSDENGKGNYFRLVVRDQSRPDSCVLLKRENLEELAAWIAAALNQRAVR